MSNDLDAPLTHPIGTIQMWSGFLADIPFGWFICDGNNGTPDLTSRFLRGSPDLTDPGNTGGSDTHTLTEAEMDQHSHSYTNPTHTHDTGNGGTGGHTLSSIDFPTSTTSPRADVSGNSVDNTGSGNSHTNLPSYFELAFIQKVE